MASKAGTINQGMAARMRPGEHSRGILGRSPASSDGLPERIEGSVQGQLASATAAPLTIAQARPAMIRPVPTVATISTILLSAAARAPAAATFRNPRHRRSAEQERSSS